MQRVFMIICQFSHNICKHKILFKILVYFQHFSSLNDKNQTYLAQMTIWLLLTGFTWAILVTQFTKLKDRST